MTIAPRALVLDFGGVISRTMFETHAETERALNLAPGTLTWRGPFDPSTDAPWQQMQAGQISERDYWLRRAAEVGALVGERWTSMAELVRRARGNAPRIVIRPEALAAIERCAAAGIKLGILSNELDLFYGADFRAKLPFLARFDTIVDATYSNLLKPDPMAYATCADALGVSATECVFVDDQPRNVKGARDAGMHAVQFDVRNPQASFSEALTPFRLSISETPHA
ncbi:HAD-IA family hydrolase [Steroidobacter sp.]|uniref:HAD-IA family hydrolase n=1 Tax=Steroidobacter sp. TaxID=1978227 RepID=UPI001A499E93|nr:HAD-IA family hydrolase [Steroidobacter sp.]MBL8266669.1 HAD-IA family hydrolase [Steroidobacter sp.]